MLAHCASPKAHIQSTSKTAGKGVKWSPGKSDFDCLKTISNKTCRRVVYGALWCMEVPGSLWHPQQIKSGFLQFMAANGTCQDSYSRWSHQDTATLWKSHCWWASSVPAEPVFTPINLDQCTVLASISSYIQYREKNDVLGLSMTPWVFLQNQCPYFSVHRLHLFITVSPWPCIWYSLLLNNQTKLQQTKMWSFLSDLFSVSYT